MNRSYHHTTVGRAVSWIALILKLKRKRSYYELMINKRGTLNVRKTFCWDAEHSLIINMRAAVHVVH